MKIDKKTATRVLLEEAANAESGNIDKAWESRIEEFSKVCEQSTRTHIAFLGTALLAKSVSVDVDVYAVKAGSTQAGAYSARVLGHGVLVPLAPKLGINLGVTGREPLNNQPYFQIKRVTPDITISENGRAGFEEVWKLLEIISKYKTTDQARVALRAFIHVRRKYSPDYAALDGAGITLTPARLVNAIEAFVSANSEGGKRAQAVVAGLMDLYAGTDRVATTRVNDPDRRIPGDVGIYVKESQSAWEKMIEVRDKPVKEADLYHFAQKSIDAKVGEAAMVAAARNQDTIDIDPARDWAAARGVALSVFIGWDSFVRQALFWSAMPQLEGAQGAPKLIYERIIGLEVSEDGASEWRSLVSG